MRRFFTSEDGFVLALSLIMLPVFFGFALLIIDLGRGNNAHGDLQAAADALALAGAAELDGEPGAIAEANAAMEEISNSVHMLSPDPANSQNVLPYSTGSGTDGFDVVFLSNIPAEDTTPLDAAYLAANSTNNDANAEYVFVNARSNDLQPIFQRIIGRNNSVPIGAWAVATFNRSACQVAPVYICNPFEPATNIPPTGDTTSDFGFLASFEAGDLHGRLFELFYSSQSTSGSGNWGFLRIPGAAGTADVRDAMAGNNPVCYENFTVDTEPGNFANAVAPGVNVRFGEYTGAMNSATAYELERYYTPDENVGHDFGDNDGMLLPGHANGFANGAFGEDHNWNLDGVCLLDNDEDPDPLVEDFVLDAFSHTNADIAACNSYDDPAYPGPNDAAWAPGYWEVKHGTAWNSLGLTQADLDNIIQTYPNAPVNFKQVTMPSRYDIYRYENSLGSSYQTPPPSNGINARENRRESYSAVVNCLASDIQGQADDLDLVLNMTIFLTEPIPTTGTDNALRFEITDMTGFSNSTSLDEKFREESTLVR